MLSNINSISENKSEFIIVILKDIFLKNDQHIIFNQVSNLFL